MRFKSNHQRRKKKRKKKTLGLSAKILLTST